MRNSDKTWGDIIGLYCSLGKQTSIERKLKDFKTLRWEKMKRTPISETTDLDFLDLMKAGGTYTQEVLKTLQNYALDQRDLERPVMAKKWWIKRGKKNQRAITLDEHRLLVAKHSRDQLGQIPRITLGNGSLSKRCGGFSIGVYKKRSAGISETENRLQSSIETHPKSPRYCCCSNIGQGNWVHSSQYSETKQ